MASSFGTALVIGTGLGLGEESEVMEGPHEVDQTKTTEAPAERGCGEDPEAFDGKGGDDQIPRQRPWQGDEETPHRRAVNDEDATQEFLGIHRIRIVCDWRTETPPHHP